MLPTVSPLATSPAAQATEVLGGVIDGAERPLGAFTLRMTAGEVFEQGLADMETIIAALPTEKADRLAKALKSGAAVRRIGGCCTTPSRDRKGERIVQTALNFAPFLEYGAFNDNHSPLSAHVVGVPVEAFSFAPGWKSPSGRSFSVPGHWASGVMLNTRHANDLYEVSKALTDTGLREMGMSVQGAITMRAAEDRSTIMRGDVLEIAITHIPTNAETSFEELAKSMLEKHIGLAEISVSAPSRLDADDLAKLIQKSRPKFSSEKCRHAARAWIALAQP